MDKIKFVVLMIIIFLLYQSLFLETDIFANICIALTIGSWLLGTRKIKKDSLTPKISIYGFIVLWTILTFILINRELDWDSTFILSNHFWIYSLLPIFIISKILSCNAIKEKFEYSDKYMIILSIVLFIVGFFITSVIYNATYYDFAYIEGIIALFNVTIFSLQLINTTAIKIDNKSFIATVSIFAIIIILTTNIIPIYQINKTIKIEDTIIDIVESNTLTYNNISTKLGTYASNELAKLNSNTNMIMVDQISQHQLEIILTDIVGSTKIANRKNFNEILNHIEKLLGNFSIDSAKYYRNIRIVTLSLNIILIIILGIFALTDRKKFYNNNY